MSKFKPDCTNGPRRIEFGEILPFATGWRGMADGQEKYQAYLCSREWAEKRQVVLDRCGGICERCNLNPVEAVHHKTYLRKYTELPEDLQGLCPGCHAYIHNKSDLDPAVKEREHYALNAEHPLTEMLSGEWAKGSVCVCPLPDCTCDNVHFGNPVCQNSELIIIPMFCEHQHKWEVCFRFDQGTTTVFSRKIEDDIL